MVIKGGFLGEDKKTHSALNNSVFWLYMALNLMLDLSEISAFFAAATVVLSVLKQKM